MKNFLLIEDDIIDVKTVKRALKKSHLEVELFVATNGEEAISKLLGKDGFEKIPFPSIVILDLNMPRMNGIEFLTKVREDEELRSLIIIVLTTSQDERDIYDAYDKNVAGYIVKPLVFSDLIETFIAINDYWSMSELPG